MGCTLHRPAHSPRCIAVVYGMKQPSKQIDWAALRIHLQRIASEAANSGDGTIQVTPETERYVKLQKFIRRHARVAEPDMARDAMIDLAEEFHLTMLQAVHLFVELQHLSSRHRFGKNLESYARAGSFARELEKVQKSIDMLADFSQRILADNAGAKERTVEAQLENAAHFWAANEKRESDKPGRYERWENGAKASGFGYHKSETSSGIFVNFDSSVVLRTWLRNNILFSKLLTQIIKEEHEKPETANLDDPDSYGKFSIAELVVQLVRPTEIESLAGVWLPELYSRYIGRDYGFSTEANGQTLANRAGPKFALMCMPVMGLTALGLETLRTHWKNANKKNKVGHGEVVSKKVKALPLKTKSKAT